MEYTWRYVKLSFDFLAFRNLKCTDFYMRRRLVTECHEIFPFSLRLLPCSSDAICQRPFLQGELPHGHFITCQPSFRVIGLPCKKVLSLLRLSLRRELREAARRKWRVSKANCRGSSVNKAKAPFELIRECVKAIRPPHILRLFYWKLILRTEKAFAFQFGEPIGRVKVVNLMKRGGLNNLFFGHRFQINFSTPLYNKFVD